MKPTAPTTNSPVTPVASHLSVEDEIMQMQEDIGVHHKTHHVFLIIVVIVTVIYALYWMNVIPKSVLSLFTSFFTGVSQDSPHGDDDSTDTTKYGAPVGSSSQLHYKDISGSVVFRAGGRANIGKVSCDNYGIDPKQKQFFVDNNRCDIKVNPCDLIKTTLDTSPMCHTVDSLCGSGPGKGLVPWIHNNTFCSLKEAGGRGDTSIYLAGVTVPEGISIDINEDKGCNKKSVFSKVCTSSNGCAWNQSHYQNDRGFQFGVAPGYQLKCNGTVRYGSPP